MSSSYIFYAFFGGAQQGYLHFYLPFLGPGYKIEGFVAPGFERVREAFVKTYRDKWEVTSQLSVFHRGKEVVNLWGMIDGKKTDATNITMLYSSGKLIESFCIMLLVQRGLCSYEDPIAKYWPEFAKNGKGDIRIEEVLSHIAGLAIQPQILTLDLINDGPKLCEMFENMTPKYRGQFLYHGHTRGLLIGEVVRRVDPAHRSISQFVKEEFVDPLNVEYYIGNVPESMFGKVLEHSKPRVGKMLVNSLLRMLLPRRLGGLDPDTVEALKSMADSKSDFYHVFNDHDLGTGKEIWTRGNHSSVLTISNAHSLAKLASLIGNNGSVDDVKVFEPQTIQQAIANEKTWKDLGTRQTFHFTKAGLNHWAHSWGWDGTGGSAFRCNPELGLGIGFVPTGLQFGMDSRFTPIEACIAECAKALGN